MNNIYHLGRLSIDRIKMKVEFPDGDYIYCTKQIYALLSAFIDSGDFFLSNDVMIDICGWNKSDIGLNEKRRTAIAYFRKRLRMDEFGLCVKYIRIRDGYQLIIEQ